MPQLAVHGPLDERDGDHDLRLYPVCAHARQPGGDREWRLGDFSGFELRAELSQQRMVEPGANLSGIHEVRALVISDQQRAQPDACAVVDR
jgi:hypothetical protein